MENFNLRKYLAEGKLLKEELTWYVEDENEDIRFQNDEYLKEVGKKIKEIHPDISSEDLNKIIIMTGEQYSREEDFHGDSIPSGNFVDAAVEIYTTDILAEGKLLKENITKLDNYALEIYSDFRKDPSIHFPDVKFEVDEEGFALENDSNYSQLKKYKKEIMGLHALFGEESGVKDKNGLQLSMYDVIDNI